VDDLDTARRIAPDPAGLRSLETPDGLCVFDCAQTSPTPGHVYVLSLDNVLFVRRCAVTLAGVVFVSVCGDADEPLPAAPGSEGKTPHVLGRVVWIGRET